MNLNISILGKWQKATSLVVCIFCCASLCFVHASCSDSSATEADPNGFQDSLAVYDYMLLAKGRFEAYTDSMASCHGAPPTYKQHTIALLRHHYLQVLSDRKGVRSAQVARKEFHDDGKMVNVYLNVTYNDSTSDEIQIPMVFFQNSWRIR